MASVSIDKPSGVFPKPVPKSNHRASSSPIFSSWFRSATLDGAVLLATAHAFARCMTAQPTTAAKPTTSGPLTLKQIRATRLAVAMMRVTQSPISVPAEHERRAQDRTDGDRVDAFDEALHQRIAPDDASEPAPRTGPAGMTEDRSRRCRSGRPRLPPRHSRRTLPRSSPGLASAFRPPPRSGNRLDSANGLVAPGPFPEGHHGKAATEGECAGDEEEPRQLGDQQGRCEVE